MNIQITSCIPKKASSKQSVTVRPPSQPLESWQFSCGFLQGEIRTLGSLRRLRWLRSGGNFCTSSQRTESLVFIGAHHATELAVNYCKFVAVWHTCFLRNINQLLKDFILNLTVRLPSHPKNDTRTHSTSFIRTCRLSMEALQLRKRSPHTHAPSTQCSPPYRSLPACLLAWVIHCTS